MLELDKMEIEVIGVSPLIVHNSRTANPLDPYSKKLKALTGKRNKTDEDTEAILALLWEAALYWDDSLGLFMPSENLFAALWKAAKKYKLGTKCGGVSFCNPIGYSIITDNHDDFKKLQADPKNKFVKLVVIQRNKTLSCRPVFHNWSIKFDLEFESDIIDANDIKTIFMCMARRIGLGVWTPSSPKPGNYGKFIIKSMTWTNSKGQTKNIGD